MSEQDKRRGEGIMQRDGNNCLCSRMGRICACLPRADMDPMLIQVMNEARRLRVMNELNRELDRDLMAADCKWVLFTIALQSYRYEELLVPRPPTYCYSPGYNINSLSYFAGTMPELIVLQQHLLDNLIPAEQIALVHWLLIKSGIPPLRHLQHHEQLPLWQQLGQTPQPRPQLVFRVEYSSEKALELNRTFYYSGDMEELYNLIAMPMAPRSVAQTKLEFHNDLQEACDAAELCPGWGYSLCGTLLRCVAVCEASAAEPQLFRIRYLIIYSMNYTLKMQRVRRRQWRKLHQKQQQQIAMQLQQPSETQLQQQAEPLQQQEQHQHQHQQQQEQEQEQEQEEEVKEEVLQIQEEPHGKKGAELLSQLLSHQSTLFNWLRRRRNIFAVLGCLTIASISLFVKSVRHFRRQLN